MNLLELSEQEIIRRNSMEQLRQMGIEPYPAAEYVTNAFSKEIKETFKDDAEPRPVSIAGRIMSRRIMGKASFMELQDSEGRIQVSMPQAEMIGSATVSEHCPTQEISWIVKTFLSPMLILLQNWRRFTLRAVSVYFIRK